jgi:hypothetical protein
VRTATDIAVILAVVATALAGVKEQSESRRLQYDIPRLERRRDLLERRHRASEAAVARALSARSLLLGHEGDCAAASLAGAALPAPDADLPCPPPAEQP